MMTASQRMRNASRWLRSPPWAVSVFVALLSIVGVLVLATVLAVLVYRVVPPPSTPLMLIRSIDGATPPPRRRWVPYRQISPNLVRAVIAAEDARFCSHNGFDWTEIKRALVDYGAGDRLRGASTITNQTAKNVFLWPGRNFLRKGLEAYFTVLIEAFWSKRRIMEMYLNVAEWGRGVYGADAAARRYFGQPASRLTRYQAALLAAALPNPRQRSPRRPSGYLHNRATRIAFRMSGVAIGRNRPCR